MPETVLVTGGNGFLGLNIIAELLRQNYNVRATVRNLDKSASVIKTLNQNNVPNLEHLSFAQADLSKDAGWEAAMQNITYVLSVASPVFMTIPDNPDEMSAAASAGIIRILKVAEQSHVQRVVMTANFGAIGFSNFDQHSITTEADWTNPDEPGLSLYEKSKLLAEKAAWNYINSSNSALELTTVNPVAILGPAMNEHVSGSFGIVKNVLDGSTKWIPNIYLNVIDACDVASIHVQAMASPKAAGKRFIASANGKISLPEIAELVRQQRPQLAPNVAARVIPNWFIKLAAHFNRQAAEGNLMLKMNRNISTKQAQELLDWQPKYTNEETVLAAVDTMVKYNLLK